MFVVQKRRERERDRENFLPVVPWIYLWTARGIYTWDNTPLPEVLGLVHAEPVFAEADQPFHHFNLRIYIALMLCRDTGFLL